MPRDRFVRTGLRVVAVSALAPMLAVGAAQAADASQVAHLALGTGRMEAITGAPRLPAHTVRVGAVAASTQISGSVGLKPSDEAGLQQFLSEVTDKGSAQFHHYLTEKQFVSRYGAPAATADAVASYLRADGLKASVSSNRILVDFHSTATKVEKAFGTSLSEYRFSDDKTGWATTSAIRLPSTLAKSVSGVTGLDNLLHYSTSLEQAPRTDRKAPPHAKLPAAAAGAPSACAAATDQDVYGGVTDDEVSDAYGVDGLYDAGDLGQGQTVDIFELEPFLMSDVKAFDKCYFGSGTTNYEHVSAIPVDGGSGTGPGEGEAALDVENVAAIAPDANINVYEGPNTTYGSLDVYNTIAEADNAKVVSTSWGLCEPAFQQGSPGTQEVESEIFAETAAQGQSVFAAAGDDGSNDCGYDSPVPPALAVDDPESQPYVTSVGGTTFTNVSEPPSETVWNDGSYWGAGGGGISNTWAEPSWQSEATVAGISDEAGTGTEPCSDDPSGAATNYNLQGIATTLASGTSCRMVPDVTALADEFTGITIYWDGEWTTIGGTSSSTPLWAAMTADMNASSFCSGTSLGFISPLLYAVASSSASDYADAFNDITVGDNDNEGVGNGTEYPATTGYDLASGLGSPKITDGAKPGLAEQACDMVASTTNPLPSVTTVEPQSGPTTGSTDITITGTNFGSSTGSVYVGTQPATITDWTATEILAKTPPYTAPPGTGSPAAGSAPVTVVTASPELSSQPWATASGGSVFHYLAGTLGTDPVVDYVGPSAGAAAGGGDVDIVGSGLSDATGVTFGGQDASIVSNPNDNNIEVQVPSDAGATCAYPGDTSVCQVQVQVTTATGTSAESTIEPAYTGTIEIEPSGVLAFTPGTEVVPAPTEYDYAPTPTVTSVTPPYGSENGNTLLDLNGSGFNVLTYEWTDFGPAADESSQDFEVQSITPTDLYILSLPDYSLEKTTTNPVAESVTIQSAIGSYTVPSDLFALAGVPVVTKISSHYGSTEGGESLAITGEGLSDLAYVAFASPPATELGAAVTTAFTSETATKAVVVTPGDVAAATKVVACTETGCDNAASSVTDYTFGYPGTPVISKLSSTKGPAKGGDSLSDPLVISGSLLDSVVAVKFGTTEATLFENPPSYPGGYQSYSVLVAPPPGTAGKKVEVSVETAGGIATGHPWSNTKSYTYEKSAPSAPVDIAGKAGDGTLTGTWKPPVSTGGATITGYVVEITAKSHKTLRESVSATTRSHEFKGVAKGVKWTVKVAAVNHYGTGYYGSSAAVNVG